LPVLFVVIVSFWVAWRPERTERLRLTVVVVMLAVCSYYLGYPCVWEYHYTTLLPCVAMLVLLYSEESDPARRRMLAIALGLGASVFLPTLYFLFHAHPVREVIEPAMTMCRATRVLPVLGLYLVLLADLLRRLRGIPPETLAAPSAASSGERRRDKLKAARVH
ncbi:MAG: hypothetical protein SFU86_19515, partial [Pirellulaceae bacterium]|nr:hypothetical protein [Pirellulaceae bacterium]